jgi:5-bromo-4-chloroindolyl phosphate hydrolysis protein
MYALGGIGNVILMGILASIPIILAIIFISAYIQDRKDEREAYASREPQRLQRRIELLEAEAPDYEVWLEALHAKVDRQFFSRNLARKRELSRL